MDRTYIKQVFADSKSFADKKIKVCGWARTIRDSKVFGFMELNDGSCFKCLQVVFEDGKIDNFDEISKLNVGSAVRVEGTLVLTPENKRGICRIRA